MTHKAVCISGPFDKRVIEHVKPHFTTPGKIDQAPTDKCLQYTGPANVENECTTSKLMTYTLRKIHHRDEKPSLFWAPKGISDRQAIMMMLSDYTKEQETK